MRRRQGSYVMTPAEEKRFKKHGARANSRIKRAEKYFREEYNTKILPLDIGGRWEVKQKWETASSPISLSKDRFNSKQEYKDYMNDVDLIAVYQGTHKDLLKAQGDRTIAGVEGSLGFMTPELEGAIRQLNPKQQVDLWEAFENRTRGLSSEYSSEAALLGAFGEALPADVYNLIMQAIGTTNKFKVKRSVNPNRKMGYTPNKVKTSDRKIPTKQQQQYKVNLEDFMI